MAKGLTKWGLVPLGATIKTKNPPKKWECNKQPYVVAHKKQGITQ